MKHLASQELRSTFTSIRSFGARLAEKNQAEKRVFALKTNLIYALDRRFYRAQGLGNRVLRLI